MRKMRFLRIDHTHKEIHLRFRFSHLHRINHAQNLKGYGFVLQYDQSKYESVEARQIDQNLLERLVP